MSEISAITMSPRFTTKAVHNFKNISLFIAHVFPNFSPADVAAVFERLRIGQVGKVDFVAKRDRNNKKYYAAYIHFQHWFDNTAARNFQSRVLNPAQEARIVYDDPWHWVVLPYKNKMINKKKMVASKKQIDNEFAFTDAHLAKVSPAFDDIDSLGRWAIKMNTPDDEMDSLEDAMEELEDVMEQDLTENDKYLVTIDSRYVQALEQENQAWRQWVVDQHYSHSISVPMELAKSLTIPAVKVGDRQIQGAIGRFVGI
jgi:hypothetical protein